MTEGEIALLVECIEERQQKGNRPKNDRRENREQTRKKLYGVQ